MWELKQYGGLKPQMQEKRRITTTFNENEPYVLRHALQFTKTGNPPVHQLQGYIKFHSPERQVGFELTWVVNILVGDITIFTSFKPPPKISSVKLSQQKRNRTYGSPESLVVFVLVLQIRSTTCIYFLINQGSDIIHGTHISPIVWPRILAWCLGTRPAGDAARTNDVAWSICDGGASEEERSQKCKLHFKMFRAGLS